MGTSLAEHRQLMTRAAKSVHRLGGTTRTAEWEADPRVLQLIRDTYLAAPFLRFIGCELMDVQAGFCEVRVPLKPELLNRHGFPHGGVITTLMDTCVSQTVTSVLPLGSRSVTIQLSTTFLAVGSGDTLLAHGRLVHLTNSLAMVEGSVYDAAHTHVAVSTGVFRVWLPKK